ncbi:hypothetical protein D9619_008270 [Psilocybe cf. subviscida]|uniref:Alpha-L-arabinofuranosidase n=1 Tax=Psilocybe cf. subviscida TaxID=2480587 RepID=A0A8H5ESN6_9AGAR|nr:hypothetical protein D9619_008270 [Psilocybe cf. subviscida]
MQNTTPMINVPNSQAIFSGGTYTQVNNIHHQQQQIPWDTLQAAAAPSAFHDSGDYFDAPRCDPNTLAAVMNQLRDFALRQGDMESAKILWLTGAAGAGKSAIARSLCEECTATDSLLASFFFNRSDPSRNNQKAFVATIAYQVYGSIPPEYQSLVLKVIERDPLVFTRSVNAQFHALIVAPLRELFENGYFNTIGKRLIVVDGLDECSTPRAQTNILTMIQKVSQRTDFPFIFLISSRPENEIQAFFSTPSIAPLLQRIDLNDFYDPDDKANIIATGYATSQASVPALNIGSSISLRATTAGCTARFIAHSGATVNTQVVTLRDSTVLKQAASWTVRPGLANSAGFSFESRDTPGSFIRHCYSQLMVNPDDGSKLFSEDATFCLQTGLNGQGNTLTSWNYPTHLVRHYHSILYIASNGGDNAFDATALYNDDVSFVVSTGFA